MTIPGNQTISIFNWKESRKTHESHFISFEVYSINFSTTPTSLIICGAAANVNYCEIESENLSPKPAPLFPQPIRLSNNFPLYEQITFTDCCTCAENSQYVFVVTSGSACLLAQIDWRRKSLSRWVQLKSDRSDALCSACNLIFVACANDDGSSMIRVFMADNLQYLSTIQCAALVVSAGFPVQAIKRKREGFFRLLIVYISLISSNIHPLSSLQFREQTIMRHIRQPIAARYPTSGFAAQFLRVATLQHTFALFGDVANIHGVKKFVSFGIERWQRAKLEIGYRKRV